MTDPSAIAPFFRIPGLLRAPPVEAYLESQGIQTWSTDFLADDWHRISSAKVYDLAMKRMEAAGKGILLLHDIQARTVGALPKILHDMKARGFKIVHVVPATPDLPATPTEPEQWQSYPPSENVRIARWPKLPNFIYADSDVLTAPAASNFDLTEGGVSLALDPADRAHRRAACRCRRKRYGPSLPPCPSSQASPMRCRCRRRPCSIVQKKRARQFSHSRCKCTTTPRASYRRAPRSRPPAQGHAAVMDGACDTPPARSGMSHMQHEPAQNVMPCIRAAASAPCTLRA